jgi:hypothetical protein
MLSLEYYHIRNIRAVSNQHQMYIKSIKLRHLKSQYRNMYRDFIDFV